MSEKRVGILAGSFDPVTNGHIDIVQRALKMVDKLYILVASNSEKNSKVPPEKRAAWLKEALSFSQCIDIEVFSGAVGDFAKAHKANVIFRGVRTAKDLDTESQMAHYNSLISQGCDTVLLPSKPEYIYLSSSAVRELCHLQSDISRLVPAALVAEIRRSYGDGDI